MLVGDERGKVWELWGRTRGFYGTENRLVCFCFAMNGDWVVKFEEQAALFRSLN